jgi:hypothetical protein
MNFHDSHGISIIPLVGLGWQPLYIKKTYFQKKIKLPFSSALKISFSDLKFILLFKFNIFLWGIPWFPVSTNRFYGLLTILLELVWMTFAFWLLRTLVVLLGGVQ